MRPLRGSSMCSIVSPEAASGGAAAWTEMTDQDTLPDYQTQAEKTPRCVPSLRTPCLRPTACNRDDRLEWRAYETMEID